MVSAAPRSAKIIGKAKAWWLAELTLRKQVITAAFVAAASGSFVVLAAWLLTHGWDTNWDAVAALASAAAAIIAVAASVAALRAPQKQQAQDRTEATREILNASGEAIFLFRSAVKKSSGLNARHEMCAHAAKARHIRNTLDRLLNRPILTDGAIITGEGAISLMDAIVEQDDEYRKPSKTAVARMVEDRLSTVADIEKLVTDRAQRVADYAVSRRWPNAERRFAAVAQKGLLAALQEEAPSRQAGPISSTQHDQDC